MTVPGPVLLATTLAPTSGTLTVPCCSSKVPVEVTDVVPVPFTTPPAATVKVPVEIGWSAPSERIAPEPETVTGLGIEAIVVEMISVPLATVVAPAYDGAVFRVTVPVVDLTEPTTVVAPP